MIKRNVLIIILLLLSAVFVCYSPNFNSDFLWDDEFLVINNPLLRAPILSFQIFKQDIVNSSFTQTIYYRPVQILSYAIDYRLYGLSSGGFHFTNIFLHFLNVLLVFFLVLKVLNKKSIAFITSILFAVHPALTGSISYISGRADLLFFLFGFLFMYMFILYREKKEYIYLVTSTLCLVFSLLSKESAIVFPLLLIFMDQMLKNEKNNFLFYIPGIGVSLIYLTLHRIFLGAKYMQIFSLNRIAESVKAFSVLAAELFMVNILPVNLYMRRELSLSGNNYLVMGTFLIVIFLFLAFKKERKEILFGLGFFLIAVMPLIFVVKNFNLVAEHWMYLASFGTFLFIAIIIESVYENKGFFGRVLAALILLVLVYFYSTKIITQNQYWTDDIGLSENVLDSSKSDAAAMYFKALALFNEGRHEESQEVLSKYVEAFSNDPKAWYLKGRLDLASGNTKDAEDAFRTALKVDPEYDNAYLGMAFVSFMNADEAEGIENLEKALSINPYNSEALYMLSIAYSKSGDDRKALAVASKAREVNPYDYKTILNLADTYVRLGGLQEGAKLYLRSIELYPEKPTASIWQGLRLGFWGRA